MTITESVSDRSTPAVYSKRRNRTAAQRAFERKYVHKTPTGWYIVAYLDVASGRWIAPATWEDIDHGHRTEAITADSLSALLGYRKAYQYVWRDYAVRAAHELFGEDEGLPYTGLIPLRAAKGR